MQNIMSRPNCCMLSAIALLSLILLLSGGSPAQAYNNGYQNSQNGYWDHNHNYHAYGYHNNHRGYWNQNNGVLLWINI
jgi:hypothetical protein